MDPEVIRTTPLLILREFNKEVRDNEGTRFHVTPFKSNYYGWPNDLEVTLKENRLWIIVETSYEDREESSDLTVAEQNATDTVVIRRGQRDLNIQERDWQLYTSSHPLIQHAKLWRERYVFLQMHGVYKKQHLKLFLKLQ